LRIFFDPASKHYTRHFLRPKPRQHYPENQIKKPRKYLGDCRALSIAENAVPLPASVNFNDCARADKCAAAVSANRVVFHDNPADKAVIAPDIDGARAFTRANDASDTQILAPAVAEDDIEVGEMDRPALYAKADLAESAFSARVDNITIAEFGYCLFSK
jgi:hypothetical protein